MKIFALLLPLFFSFFLGTQSVECMSLQDEETKECISLNKLNTKYFNSHFESGDVPFEIESSEFLEKINSCSKKFKGMVKAEAAKQEKAVTAYAQKLIVPSGSQICLMGDIHGSFGSLLHNLNRLEKLGFINDDLEIIKNNFYMIFLGDYVDRGPSSVEVLYLLAELKLKNWDRVFLIRGNHEIASVCSSSTSGFSFADEVGLKYFFDGEETILSKVLEFFDYLPLASAELTTSA